MRIISGTFKGRKLRPFKGAGIRPTSDRLRESIFNILGGHVRHRRVLDLYAGTGALGIEALSRGADRAVFVDNHPGAVALIRENLTICGAADRSRVIRWNAAKNLDCLATARERFDMIFMDPPYAGHLIGTTLAHLVPGPWVAEDCWIVAEHARAETVPERLPPWAMADQRRYGKTLVSIFRNMV